MTEKVRPGMIKSDLIATFVSIVDMGSLNGAARKLGLSRSVVSDRLNALEADLGTQLVTRSTHGLSLTSAGQAFLEHARALIIAMDTARDAVTDASGAITGRLRVAAPAALTNEWLTPIFARFLERHPRVDLDISVADRTVDIVKEGFDLAIRSARHPDSALLARKLTTGRRIVVCSPDYKKRFGVPGGLDDLPDHQAVIYSNRRTSEDWTFRTDDGVRSARMTGRLEVNDGAVGRQAALEGVGICLLPTFLVSRALVSGRLIKIDLGVEPDMDSVSAVYPKAAASLQRLQALVVFLRDSLGDPPVWDRDLADAGLVML